MMPMVEPYVIFFFFVNSVTWQLIGLQYIGRWGEGERGRGMPMVEPYVIFFCKLCKLAINRFVIYRTLGRGGEGEEGRGGEGERAM